MRRYRPAWCYHMLRLRWGAAALEHYGISLSSLASKEVHDAEVQPSEVHEHKDIASAVLLADRPQSQRQALNQQLSRQSALPSSAAASHASLKTRQSPALSDHRSSRMPQHAAV